MSDEQMTVHGLQEAPPRNPFVMIEHAILTGTDLSPNAICTYLALRTFANFEGQNAFPSMPTLAKRAHISVSSVKRAVEELRDAGLIRKILRKREGTESNTSNLYVVYHPSNLPEVGSHRTDLTGKGQSTQNRGVGSEGTEGRFTQNRKLESGTRVHELDPNGEHDAGASAPPPAKQETPESKKQKPLSKAAEENRQLARDIRLQRLVRAYCVGMGFRDSDLKGQRKIAALRAARDFPHDVTPEELEVFIGYQLTKEYFGDMPERLTMAKALEDYPGWAVAGRPLEASNGYGRKYWNGGKEETSMTGNTEGLYRPGSLAAVGGIKRNG